MEPKVPPPLLFRFKPSEGAKLKPGEGRKLPPGRHPQTPSRANHQDPEATFHADMPSDAEQHAASRGSDIEPDTPPPHTVNWNDYDPTDFQDPNLANDLEGKQSPEFPQSPATFLAVTHQFHQGK